MGNVIIDTNVVVVANRQNPQVAATCVNACIRFLAEVPVGHVVLLDDGDEIRTEYVRALQMGRPYQLGAQFLIHVLRQQYNPQRVRRVALEKTVEGEFIDFPAVPELSDFDPSDRKFAALARVTNTPVTNAIDSDWADSLQALEANGVSVTFLCGRTKNAWHVP